MIVVAIMPAMFAPAIMTVDPMVTMVRPMAGDPDHLVIAFPVTRAVAVKWPVTEFDPNSLRLDGAPESEARNADRCE
jgi:hypothetical protein